MIDVSSCPFCGTEYPPGHPLLESPLAARRAIDNLLDAIDHFPGIHNPDTNVGAAVASLTAALAREDVA
jgi:hypothetical protein